MKKSLIFLLGMLSIPTIVGNKIYPQNVFSSEKPTIVFDSSEPVPASPEQYKNSISTQTQNLSLDRIVDSESLKNYQFNSEDLKKYQKWVFDTIESSRKNKNAAMIVDKSNYTLDLYKGGKLVRTFPVEFGFNPIDDKKMEGDGSTPEGKYFVTAKKDKGTSWFYRSFVINYPNEFNARKFRENKAKGIIPKDSTIGGDIAIHGCGSGKGMSGFNWTLGCVALSNSDMDVLFPYGKEGTPVTIVKYGTRKIGF
jgi:hypothetical protein